MSVLLSDIIGVLDAAYPPGLAADWDSVGLVCGDPDEPVATVTVAVDATGAVVAEVPDRGLLLAHHPLLLRGVDTVAASTAKGALLHQMIRSGEITRRREETGRGAEAHLEHHPKVAVGTPK